MANPKHWHKLPWRCPQTEILIEPADWSGGAWAAASHWGKRGLRTEKGHSGVMLYLTRKGKEREGLQIKDFQNLLGHLKKKITKPTCDHPQSNNQQALWGTSPGRSNCLPLFPDRGRSREGSSISKLLIVARLRQSLPSIYMLISILGERNPDLIRTHLTGEWTAVY